MKRLLMTTAIIAGAMWFHHPVANAALVACPEPGFTTEPGAKVENATGTMTATLGCQYLAPPDNSNVATIANINAGDFFGSNMWQANSAGNTCIIGPGGQTGTWAISNADFTHFDYGDFLQGRQRHESDRVWCLTSNSPTARGSHRSPIRRSRRLEVATRTTCPTTRSPWFRSLTALLRHQSGHCSDAGARQPCRSRRRACSASAADPSSSCLTGWTTGETWTNSVGDARHRRGGGGHRDRHRRHDRRVRLAVTLIRKMPR